MVKIIIITVILTITLLAAAAPALDQYQYLHPLQNYRHWKQLKEVCESGRKTYGANEYVKNGQVCRWTFVPYYPFDPVAPK